MSLSRLRTWLRVSLCAVAIGGCTSATPPPVNATAPDSSSSRATAKASLETTYWKLSVLRGKPVETARNQQEPFFVLRPEQKRLTGSGGCNRLIGGYTVEGDRLSFTGVASTRMACVQAMDQERAFLEALSTVARWRVDGERLELLDDQGVAVLQFDARTPQ